MLRHAEILLSRIHEDETKLIDQSLAADHQWLDLMLDPFAKYVKAVEENADVEEGDATGAAILAAYYAELPDYLDFGTWYLSLDSDEFEKRVHASMAKYLPYAPHRQNHNYQTANVYHYLYLPVHYYGCYSYDEMRADERFQHPKIQSIFQIILDSYSLTEIIETKITCLALENHLRSKAQRLGKEQGRAYRALAEFISFCFTESNQNYLFHHTETYHGEELNQLPHWGDLYETQIEQEKANLRYEYLLEGIQLLENSEILSEFFIEQFEKYYPRIQKLKAKRPPKSHNQYQDYLSLKEQIQHGHFRRRLRIAWPDCRKP